MRNNRANFTHRLQGNLLILEDVGSGNTKSLTNDLEACLLDMAILLEIDLTTTDIIYCDSDGQWDAVKWNGKGEDVTFISLNADTLDEAKQKLYGKQR